MSSALVVPAESRLLTPLALVLVVLGLLLAGCSDSDGGRASDEVQGALGEIEFDLVEERGGFSCEEDALCEREQQGDYVISGTTYLPVCVATSFDALKPSYFIAAHPQGDILFFTSDELRETDLVLGFSGRPKVVEVYGVHDTDSVELLTLAQSLGLCA